MQKRWLYRDQLRITAELDGAGNLVSRFIYASRSSVPDFVVRNGVTYRVTSNHLGSPGVIVDANDTSRVVRRVRHDAWGLVLEDSNPDWMPFGFAGSLRDEDTALVRFGARDYDPATGRWTAKDPILFRGRQPNLYAYVGNNPVNRIDPTGLTDRGWPLNGQISNHSSGTVWGYDYDYDVFVPVPPSGESSNGHDVDFVHVGDTWYKIGPWDFDVDADGSPDDGFDPATPDDLRHIEDWDKRHPHRDWWEPNICR